MIPLHGSQVLPSILCYSMSPLYSQIFPSLCVSTLFLWVENHFSSTLSDIPQCQPEGRHLARGYECRNALMQGVDLSNADKQSLTDIGKSRPVKMPTTGQEPVLSKKITGSLKGEPRVAHHTHSLGLLFVWLSVHWREMFTSHVCFSLRMWFCNSYEVLVKEFIQTLLM